MPTTMHAVALHVRYVGSRHLRRFQPCLS